MKDKTPSTDSVNKQEQPTNAQIEGVKLVCDFLKHLTTLSTGSIVIIATFREKLGAQMSWRSLAAIAVGGFILSTLGALVGAGVLVFRAEVGEFSGTTGAEQHIEGFALLASFAGFFVALLSLAILAVKNFL
jgi:hypothetical protein